MWTLLHSILHTHGTGGFVPAARPTYARRGHLPANKNVRWALGANLWNSFPRVPFTDILDVMKDTGFIGIRMTQFPQILNTYSITVPELQKELSKRGCHII